MKNYLMLLSCFFVSLVIQAQIKGVVLDAETREPLEYATVFCKEEAIGTITNKDGKFSLFLKNPENTVTFSFMGYNTVEAQLSSNNEILLKKAPIELNEIVVTPVEDAKKILSSVVKRYRENHHVNKTICDIYLKQFELSNGRINKAVNMIGELEIPIAKDLDKMDKYRLSAISADVYLDTTIIDYSFLPEIIGDIFSTSYEITNFIKKYSNIFNFHTSKIYQDNSIIYKIDFSRKKKKKGRNQFSGTIFIDGDTKAILECNIHQNQSYMKEKHFKHNGESFYIKPQEAEIKISYLKMDNGEYLMTYALAYIRLLLNNEHRDFNMVISNNNFAKSSFSNQHPIDFSKDILRQLQDKNIGGSTYEYNKIVPTEEELEFFEKNK